VSICTNKPEGWRISAAAALGVREAFGALVGADTLPVRKPDPAPYRAAVERAGGWSARSMLVGDTETDAKTGVAAGVPVALVTFGPEGRGWSRFAPAALLDRFEDLPGLAGRFWGSCPRWTFSDISMKSVH
jgi:phosphoglycolate phosphatase